MAPPQIPMAVLEAIAMHLEVKHGKPPTWMEVVTFVFEQLQWNLDHWYFHFKGMYIGVEPDGHMHT